MSIIHSKANNHLKHHCCSNCKNKIRVFFNHRIVMRCNIVDRDVQKSECCDKYEMESGEQK